MQILSWWKSGLWILGRVYKSAWSILFKPSDYDNQFRLNDSSLSKMERSLLDKVRYPIFEWSQRLLYNWSPDLKEDLLRSIDTSAQFTYFKKDMSLPLSKIELIYPSHLTKIKSYCLNTGGMNVGSISTDLARSRDDYLSKRSRSIRALLITCPFYFVIPYSLYEIDKLQMLPFLVSQYDKFISLPLAYNLIKLFSYHRCSKSSNLFSELMKIDENVVKPLKQDQAQVQNQLLKTSSDKEREILNLKLHAIQNSIGQQGIHYSQLNDHSNIFDEFYDRAGKVSSSQEGLIWIDRKTLGKISREYQIDGAQLYKTIVKSIEKTKLRLKEKDLSD